MERHKWIGWQGRRSGCDGDHWVGRGADVETGHGSQKGSETYRSRRCSFSDAVVRLVTG